jgi:hypothetical protein
MLQNLLISVARAAASSVLGTAKSVVLHLESLVGDASKNEPMFSALGVVARPKPPVSLDAATGLSPEGECEVLAIKNEDGLAPFAYRDLRISQRLNVTPSEGDVFLAGYGGGYVSIRAATGDLGSVVTMRAARLNGSGVDQGAHTLVLDSHTAAAPAIALTHLGGYSIRITNAGDTEVRNKLVVAPDSPQLQAVVASGDFTAWVTSVTTAVNAIIALLTVAPPSTPVVTVAPAGLPVVVPPSSYQSTKLTAAI